jgi:hypothetical protein
MFLKLAAPVVADSPVYTYTPAAISYDTREVYHDYADTLAELKAAGPRRRFSIGENQVAALVPD